MYARLMTMNPFAGARTVKSAPAAPEPTERQVEYLTALARQVHGENADEYLLSLQETGRWTKRYVSAEIETLKDRARTLTVSKVEGVPEGFHVHGTEVFKVQRAPGEPRGTWEYVGRSVLRFLSAETVLTLEKAREFGHLYGICARCGATLTDEESIRRGIGPVCAGRF